MADGAGYRQSVVVTEDLMRYMSEMGPGQNRDFLRRLKWASIGSTKHLISNCESVTDWDISSSGDFNAVDEATIIYTGSNSLELQDVSTTTGTFVTLDEGHRPNDEDWSEFNWLCIHIADHSATARLAGELKIQIRNNGDWCTAISVPIVQTTAMFELKCIDISAVARAHVDGFRFVNNRGTGSSEKVYISEMFVTDVITGVGDGTAAFTGPAYGRIIAMPIATGATIVPGDAVKWTINGINTLAANAFVCVGVACQHTPVETSRAATDALPKEMLVATLESIVWGRNSGTAAIAGEPILMGSDVVAEAAGSAAANAEYGIGITLEANGTYLVSGDSAYLLHPSNTED